MAIKYRNLQALFRFLGLTDENAIENPRLSPGISLQSRAVLEVSNTVTLAELNAGKTIFTGIPNHYVRPISFNLIVTGAFTTGTSLDLVSTDGTNIASVAVAGLTNGARLDMASSNVTLGAGFNPATMVTAMLGSGLKIQKTGSSFAGGTSVRVCVMYKLVDSDGVQ